MSTTDETNPITTTDNPIDKDFDFVCCGRELCNIPPRTVLAAVFSGIGIVISIVFLIAGIGPQIAFVALLSSLVTLWAPSPLQSSSARKDIIENASLLQNMYGNQVYQVKNGRFMMKRPPMNTETPV